MSVRVAIAGATGRMGRELLAHLRQEPGLSLASALVRAGDAQLGADASLGQGAPMGVALTADLAAISTADVFIDFTRPAAALAHVAECARRLIPVVIGTTGFTEAEKQALRNAAASTPVLLAPNTALGVNVLFKLVEVAAHALRADADMEIIEAHHRRKLDAPSGTALKLGELMAQAMGKALAELAVYERQGETGERVPGSIGFATVRGGDIIGDHTALFALPGERIEITHRSQSRATYARGAFAAARFLVGKPPGFYDMFDVLGLR